ncbi:MAG: aldehyde dehydrogenase [Mesorhizobium sp.]|uniref:aldehyde dehydrogenase n=1 Tax=Mesorhizobium sp. TaxID=1871066 RepID=UPI000FEA3E39|nr:aldehyde dehydrogenase [Mesorhizobium sp.]RWA97286.1 MAG: aldehyde dehydrogenase [Mesorhizobium sp.]RWK58655.1 MAG: aldehyde dehydrogenase [Mesorhizobium sp.]RWM43121.1 MAG: aldehyde dehydrogenase [Mesorhizobium sp.]RWM45869.1 MAG: aldehyde dehydrogenase [Mesorhizobium sp.]RWM75080.1 MAG: aldehyde dehydrogenase [Mesorhizobium sp.]
MLNKIDYKTQATALKLPSKMIVDGVQMAALSGKTFATLNPATGEVLAELPAASAADVDRAVAAARLAFEDGRWSKLAPANRKKVLLKLASVIEENALELALMESLDSGKTISDCINIDVPEAINSLKWHAEAVDKIYDQVSPANDASLGLIVREPIGVVGLVLPWNFPLLMLAWKIGPALAAGCTIVVKPAEETSLTTLRVAELALDAGLPAGVFNVLTGDGPDVGEPIGRHPDVDAVSFTGSTDTGRRFLKYSSESNLKEVVLEMGGKNPCIVMDDVPDLDAVASHIGNGAFWNMGQNCSAISRVFVHKDVKGRLLEKLTEVAKTWTVGDPLDPETRIGPLISAAHFEKVSAYLEGDGKVVTGGKVFNGTTIEPTIIEFDYHDSKHVREEIFGPIVSVIGVNSLAEAVSLANETEYGLAASVFTADGTRALRAARAIKAGTVTVNCYGEGDAATPFGGYKQSGFGGRDKSLHAHDQYCQTKTLWIDLSNSNEGF